MCLRNKLIYLFLLVTLALASVRANESAVLFVRPDESLRFIPFLVDIDGAKRNYADSALGIEILSITVDGKNLAGVPSSLKRYVDRVVVFPLSGARVIIQQVGVDSLMTLRDDHDGLIKFSLPASFQTVVLNYRTRFVDQSMGAERQVVVVKTNGEDAKLEPVGEIPSIDWESLSRKGGGSRSGEGPSGGGRGAGRLFFKR